MEDQSWDRLGRVRPKFKSPKKYDRVLRKFRNKEQWHLFFHSKSQNYLLNEKLWSKKGYGWTWGCEAQENIQPQLFWVHIFGLMSFRLYKFVDLAFRSKMLGDTPQRKSTFNSFNMVNQHSFRVSPRPVKLTFWSILKLSILQLAIFWSCFFAPFL